MLTSFKIEEHGYRTVYLNEPLSMGLAPEGLHAYLTQRCRWCLGAMQQIYTRWSFAGPARLRFISRLSSFDGALYWIFAFPFKSLMLTAPLVFWWTGTAVIDCTAASLIEWLAPSVVAGIMFMSFYSRHRVLPIMTDVTQLLPSFMIMRTVDHWLADSVRPTVQGYTQRLSERRRCYVELSAAFHCRGFGNIFRDVDQHLGLFGAERRARVRCQYILEPLQYRNSAPRSGGLHRAAATARARALPCERAGGDPRTGEAESPCTIVDISLGGAKLAGSPPAWAKDGWESVLLLDGGALHVPFRFIGLERWQNFGQGFPIVFETGKALRRALTVRLFGGAYAGNDR